LFWYVYSPPYFKINKYVDNYEAYISLLAEEKIYNNYCPTKALYKIVVTVRGYFYIILVNMYLLK